MTASKAFLCAAALAIFSTSGQAQMLDEYKPNAYGLGINADLFARPFTWQQQNGQPVAPIFQGSVRPNAYGLGVGADKFGRPVVPNYGIVPNSSGMNCIGTLKC
jgi:hypothetical protein